MGDWMWIDTLGDTFYRMVLGAGEAYTGNWYTEPESSYS